MSSWLKFQMVEPMIHMLYPSSVKILKTAMNRLMKSKVYSEKSWAALKQVNVELQLRNEQFKAMQGTLNSAYNKVNFNEIIAIMKENLHTKYTPFTYNDVVLNEKLPITQQNLHIFFIIGRVECR